MLDVFHCRAADKVPPPLLRALAGLDAHVTTAQPAEPVVWAAALAAPLLADTEPRKRGRPQKQAAFSTGAISRGRDAYVTCGSSHPEQNVSRRALHTVTPSAVLAPLCRSQLGGGT